MKPRHPHPLSRDHWKAAVRASVHPVLVLLVVNLGLTIHGFPSAHLLVAGIFGILLPAGPLVALAQTFNTRVAESNHGVFPRAARPFGYWVHVAIWFAGYVFVSTVPYLAG